MSSRPPGCFHPARGIIMGKINLGMGMAMTDDSKGNWARIILVYWLSVLGVMIISETAPLLGAIAGEFQVHSGAAIGAIMSIPALTAAIGALLIGWLVDRFGDRHLLLAGGVLVMVGDIATILAPNIEELLVGRFVGGVGYTCMAVASVAMVARISSPAQRVSALALWSTVIPMSFVIAFLSAALLAGGGHWRSSIGAHAGATALFCAAGLMWLPNRGPGEQAASRTSGIGKVLRSPWPYVLGTSFAFNAFLQTGMIAIVPKLIAQRSGAGLGQVQPFTMLAMFCNIAGAFAAGALLNRRVPAWAVGCAGIVVCGVCGGGLIFAPLTLATGVALNCGLLAGCGLLVGLWALLPTVAPSPSSFGATSGLLTQITLIGVLFGPPAALAGSAEGNSGLLLFVVLSLAGSFIGLPVWLRRKSGGPAPVAEQATAH